MTTKLQQQLREILSLPEHSDGVNEAVLRTLMRLRHGKRFARSEQMNEVLDGMPDVYIDRWEWGSNLRWPYRVWVKVSIPKDAPRPKRPSQKA